MDYDQYKHAAHLQEKSPANDALEPYWDEIIEIWRSDDPIETLAETAVEIARDSLVLATGGPHIEFTSKGYLRGRWGLGWIFSGPADADQAEAAEYVRELLTELKA